MSALRQTLSAFAILIVMDSTCRAQKARAYFDELYKVGGLDRMADGYVCFDDDPGNENFFIFGKSEMLKAFLMEHDGLKSLPAGSRAQLNKGFLTVRGYSKGVPLGDGEDQYVKDGESWQSELLHFDKVTTGRMRLRISWETMRYRRTVELTKDRTTREAARTSGRCETISPAIRQKGN